MLFLFYKLSSFSCSESYYHIYWKFFLGVWNFTEPIYQFGKKHYLILLIIKNMIYLSIYLGVLIMGFPSDSVVKKLHAHGFDPWVRRIPWRRKWQPTPVFLAWRILWTEEAGGPQSTGSQESNMTYWPNNNNNDIINLKLACIILKYILYFYYTQMIP